MEFRTGPRGRRAASLAVLLGTASLSAITSTHIARAQPVAQANQPAEPPEQVLITGSLIRGDIAIGTPVTQLGTVEFQQTGALTVSDLLKSIPSIQVEASTSIANAGGQINRAQGVDIHDLNSNTSPRTLMMIDGSRFPAQGHGTDRYDPSIIPQLAVDHIDVLPDGASATYGSDAVAGVLNVLLKRGYDGAISQTRFGTANGGDQRWQASQLWGRTWGGGDVTISYEWYDETSLTGKDRSIFTFDYTPWGLDDRTPITSAAPAIISAPNSAATKASPLGTGGASASFLDCINCYALPHGVGWNYGDTSAHTNPTTPRSTPTISWADLVSGLGQQRQNEVNPYYFSDVTAAQQRNAATITVDQQLMPGIKFVGDGFYQNRRVQQRYPVLVNPAKGQQNFRFQVPTTNPYYPSGTLCTTNPSPSNTTGTPAGCVPTNLNINYNISAELQPVNSGAEVSARWSTGLQVDLPFDWQAKLSYTKNFESNRAYVSGIANLNAVNAALGNTVSAVAATGTKPGIAAYTKPSFIPYLNPFCDPFQFHCNSNATLDYISSIRDYDEHYIINDVGGTFDGPLFDLPGGTIRAAIGADYNSHNYNFIQRQNFNQPGNIIDVAVDPEHRQVWAAFGQVSIPLVGEMNSFPLVKSLVVEGSWRYDHYNDFGGTRNPKVSLNWVPVTGLTLRGTWGTSFRAPAFSDSSAISGVQYQPVNAIAGDTDNRATCETGQTVPTPGSAADVLAHYLSPSNPVCSAIPKFPGGITIRGGAGGAALVRGGSASLEPEKATNFSAGFDFAPEEYVPGLTLTGTYFHVKINGLMQGLETTTGAGLEDPSTRFTYILPDDPNFSSYVAAILGNSKSFLNPNVAPNILFINDGAVRNTGSEMVDGFDFGATYDKDLGFLGEWNAAFNGSYYLHRRIVSITGTAPVETYSGNSIACPFCNPNSPVRFRWRGQLGWMSEGYSANLFINYQSHFYNNQSFPPAAYLAAYPDYSDIEPPYYTFDLSVGYNTRNDPQNDYLKDIDLRLIFTNLFDKHPPFMYKTSSGGSNPAAFDISNSPVGRVITFVITKTW